MNLKLLILLLLLSGCTADIIETKYKLYYVDGTTEIITLKKSSDVIGEAGLYNGCFYNYKSPFRNDNEYINQLRCGVSHMKKISFKRYSKN